MRIHNPRTVPHSLFQHLVFITYVNRFIFTEVKYLFPNDPPNNGKLSIDCDQALKETAMKTLDVQALHHAIDQTLTQLKQQSQHMKSIVPRVSMYS
ncbi:hypothetical protein ShirakiTA10_25110 [Bacillus safensis]|nr:hypothetical protein ShirakiTA10_25110 [Bacillus safensis]